MKLSDYWQNFELLKEIEVAGGFIYDGLRALHEIEYLHHETEIFSVLYNLSVGLERLIKVSIILLEYEDGIDPIQFEKTLITHNHSELISRVQKQQNLRLGKAHNEFLSLLAKFYKSYRYDRYSLDTVKELSKEKEALISFLDKHIELEFSSNILGDSFVSNTRKTKKFIGKLVRKVVDEIYSVIRNESYRKNIYTYEVRSKSKAYKFILGDDVDFSLEDILWKELLIFLLSYKGKSDHLDFIKSFDPLNFDIAMLREYLDAVKNDVDKIGLIDELEYLYEDVENKSERFERLKYMNAKDVFFDS
ncbi:hypothetical protein GCM10008090_30900 [Arenicella chitinivorans]|uniref:Uncharacterized protein n=1 Tax=Arenicella chitinivorans TaxID=1329800 RepID=A0A918VSL1_9GAMM|nr:hypothetical protein [Arenicella chitinivorans]GHA19007.1 hypothetical protein GCM10008090_30900 [Arenicella chitinivorans]